MQTIDIIIPCYNEEANIEPLYQKLKVVLEQCGNYDFKIIFIDNASTDDTVNIIKKLIHQDKRMALIINARNFGHIRSPYYGLMQSSADATILMASDLQDPPELICDFIKQWEGGYKIVAGTVIPPKNN